MVRPMLPFPPFENIKMFPMVTDELNRYIIIIDETYFKRILRFLEFPGYFKKKVGTVFI